LKTGPENVSAIASLVGWVDARKPNFQIHFKIIDNLSRILNLMKIKAIIHPAEEGGYWAEV
jgi:hypothetical protein